MSHDVSRRHTAMQAIAHLPYPPRRARAVQHVVVAFMAWASMLGPSLRDARADWRSLSGLLPAHVGSIDYKISPDSKTVAFVADTEVEGVRELYVVPITGAAAPLKLNPTLVAGGDVNSSRFEFTTDSSHVIYLADQEVDNRVEMYSVPVAGGMGVKLNPALVSGGNVTNFKIDPDTGRVVYVADQETNDVLELWSISGTGGGLFKLSGTMVSGGDISSFQIDPLSNRAVFSADRETDGKFELYSVPLVGGTPLKLNPPIVLTGGGDSGISSQFAVNTIVPVVVFIAREAASPRGSVYSDFTAGGALTKLSFNMPVNDRIIDAKISPAGDRVVFNVATSNDTQNRGFAFSGNLYSNLIGAGGAANVTETADPYNGVGSFRFTPDGSRVVYRYQKNAASPVLLESATMLGVRTPLYVPGASDPPLVSFDLSPDSQWVVYTDGDSGDLQQTIHTLPPIGGNPTNFGPGVYKLTTPDSGRIAYTRIVTADNHSELFSAQIFGGDVRELSGLDGTGFVGDVIAAPDSTAIVFVVQIDGRYDLRVSDGTEAQPPTTSTTSTTTPTGPGTTSTSTTLPAVAQEICDNCADDDGDGRVDLDDDACCESIAALTRMRGTMTLAKGGGTKLAVSATLADASLVPTAPPLPDVLVQLGPPDGAPLVCALLPAGTLKLKKRTLKFRDKPGLVGSARGFDLLALARNKRGRGSLVLAGRDTAFTPPAAGPLRLTIGTRVGGRVAACRTVTSNYRSTRKGLRAN